MSNTMTYTDMRRHLEKNVGGIIAGEKIISNLAELPRPAEYAGEDPARRAEIIRDAKRRLAEESELLRSLGEDAPELNSGTFTVTEADAEEVFIGPPTGTDPVRQAKQTELEILLLKGQGATAEDRARIEVITEELGLARLLRMAGYSAPPALSLPPQPIPPTVPTVQKIGMGQKAQETATAPVEGRPTRLKPNAATE